MWNIVLHAMYSTTKPRLACAVGKLMATTSATTNTTTNTTTTPSPTPSTTTSANSTYAFNGFVVATLLALVVSAMIIARNVRNASNAVHPDPFANNASHTRRRRSTDGVSDDVPLRRILSHQRDHLPRGIKKLGRASRELEGSTYVLCGKCEREAQLALEAGRLPPRMHALVQRSPPSGRSRSLTG
ncbi:hypothetical protein FI667_g15724, partial [Globisporangium splendens]